MHQRLQPGLKKKLLFLIEAKELKPGRMSKRKRWGKTNCCKTNSQAEFLAAFAQCQSWGVRSGIKYQICLLQYLLHSPCRLSGLEFYTGKRRSGSLKMCPRAACCPLEQQSTGPREGLQLFMAGEFNNQFIFVYQGICKWKQILWSCSFVSDYKMYVNAYAN